MTTLAAWAHRKGIARTISTHGWGTLSNGTERAWVETALPLRLLSRYAAVAAFHRTSPGLPLPRMRIGKAEKYGFLRRRWQVRYHR